MGSGSMARPMVCKVVRCYVCVSLYFLCRWQVHVSIYCVRRIPAPFRRIQCSILLHHIYICFLPCICLWHISQIQTYLRVVVRPGFVSTSPAFMRSSASHPAGPFGRFAKKGISDPSCWGREVSTQFTQQFAKTVVTAPPLVGCVVWSQLLSGALSLLWSYNYTVVFLLFIGLLTMQWFTNRQRISD